MLVLDAFESPELSVLVRLAGLAPGDTITVTDLERECAALGYSPGTLRDARVLLQDFGLLQDVRTPRGATDVAAIQLTDAGREFCEHLRLAAALVPDHPPPRKRPRRRRYRRSRR